MHVETLALRAYRNYAALQLEFHADVHLIVGDNAQGKTNLLEAIHVLSTLKSFRGATSRELVRVGEEEARIQGRVCGPAGPDDLSVTLAPTKRTPLLNGKTPETIAHYLRALPTVAFTPDDIVMFKADASPRRQALDRAVFGLRPGHLRALQLFMRALKQKNALLRAHAGRHISREIQDELDAWDAELCEAGGMVAAERASYLRRLDPVLTETMRDLSRGHWKARARYRATCDVPRDEEDSPAAWARALAEALRARRDEELRRGFAVVGPHRDDLTAEIDGRAVRRHASQGQHRMFALALKVAEIELHQRELGRYPVLLLDDVKSELDHDRAAALFGFLNRIPAQVFVTTTDVTELAPEVTRRCAVWRVQEGVVEVAAAGRKRGVA